MKNSLANPRVKSGFTLTELLIVIGIIALLAAIMFPVFGRVREGGRRTTCANNLHQLGLAFQQYQQDNRRYPLPAQYQKWADGAHWITGGKAGGTPENFDNTAGGLADPSSFATKPEHEAMVEKGALFPYVRQSTTYVCPSAPDFEKKKLSYSMNCGVAGISDVRLKTPQEIVLLVDEGDTLNDGYFWATDNSLSTDALMQKHNGGGNLLFTDSHVKFYPFKALPLDKEQAGRDIKSALTGPVRFLDKAFGPKGATVIQAMQDDPTKPPVTDSCGSGITSTPAPGI